MKGVLRLAAAILAYAAVVSGWFLLRMPRTLDLPDEAGWLVGEAGAARDAPSLLGAFRARGLGFIRVTGPFPPGLPWTAGSSGVWTDFWRLYVLPEPRPAPAAGPTAPAAAGGETTHRISGTPLPGRRLSVSEPPGLPDLGATGEALLLTHRAREALVAYTRARAMAPAAPSLMAGEAEALLALGRPREARVLFWRALQSAAPDADLFDGLGRALAAQGRKADAAVAMEQAAGLGYTNAARWLRAARAARAAGNRAGEARCLEAARTLGTAEGGE